MDDLHRRKRGENLMITVGNKMTLLADKIDFLYKWKYEGGFSLFTRTASSGKESL